MLHHLGMKLNLEELLKQKALLEEHLRWIDAKIDELRGLEASEKAESPAEAQEAVPAIIEKSVVISTEPASAPVIPKLSDYDQLEAQITASEAKKGCLIWFGVAVAAFFILIGLIYVLRPEWDEKKVEEYRRSVEEKQNQDAE